MVRFQCVHCGGRIAVQDRHLNRVAHCPDCGAMTHPLAKHLTAASGAVLQSAAKPNVGHSPVCDNCGEPLGKLQKPFAWRDHWVCGACLRALNLEREMERPTPPAAGAIVAQPPGGAVDPPTPSADRRFPLGPAPSHMPAFAPAFWGACVGLCVSAAGLYVVVVILQSLSWMIVWGGIALSLLACAYWIRRGIISLRAPRRVRQVSSIVRN